MNPEEKTTTNKDNPKIPHYSVAIYTRHPDMIEGLQQANYETIEDMEKVVESEVEKFFAKCNYSRSNMVETMSRLGVFKGTTYGTSRITIDGGKFHSFIGATYWAGFNGVNIRAFYKPDGKEDYSLEILMQKLK